MLAVLITEGSDDPPVVFSDYRRNRWTRYCDRFTDALFTQFFDWQFRLCFDEHDMPEIDYYEEFDCQLPSEEVLVKLRDRYREYPATHSFMETEVDATTWRFSTANGERILFTHDSGAQASSSRPVQWCEVLAPPDNRVERCQKLRETLESELAT